MPTGSQHSRSVRFGPFELDLVTAELRRSGLKLRLREQSFRVLALLLQHPGELVTRDALQEALWPEAVFVDREHGLNIAVAKLRRVLRDTAEAPRYVETLERRGYRFIAPVEPIETGDNASTASEKRVELPRVIRVLWARRSVALSSGVHVIGRDPGVQLWVDSPEVSRRHASIAIGDSSITINDLGSRNGTLVNGQLISSSHELHDGDVVTIGPARLVIRTEDAAGTTRIVRRP